VSSEPATETGDPAAWGPRGTAGVSFAAALSFTDVDVSLGGRSVLDKFNLAEWRRAIAEHKPRVASLPPSAMLMLLDSDATAEEFESVICFRCGTAPTSFLLRSASCSASPSGSMASRWP